MEIIILIILCLGIVVVLNRERIRPLLTTTKTVEPNLLEKMEEYYTHHSDKLNRLNKTLKDITALRLSTAEEYKKLNSELTKNKFFASEFQKQNNNKYAENVSHKLAVDNKTLKTLDSELKELTEREKFLTDYQKSYSAMVKNLRYTIDSNTREYKRKKQLAKTYSEADEFFGGNMSIENDYQKVLSEFESSTSLFTAQIMDFENRAKPQIEATKFDNEMRKFEGLRIINEYNDKLKQLKGA